MRKDTILTLVILFVALVSSGVNFVQWDSINQLERDVINLNQRIENLEQISEIDQVSEAPTNITPYKLGDYPQPFCINFNCTTLTPSNISSIPPPKSDWLKHLDKYPDLVGITDVPCLGPQREPEDWLKYLDTDIVGCTDVPCLGLRVTDLKTPEPLLTLSPEFLNGQEIVSYLKYGSMEPTYPNGQEIVSYLKYGSMEPDP